MTLAATLNKLNADALQCDGLLASAHYQDQAGAYIFSSANKILITNAAFLNLFVAWEGFLENAFIKYMTGESAINGQKPVKYVSPATLADARKMIVGINRFFDFANIDFVRKIARMYFLNGHPFEPCLGASDGDIKDMRTMRNYCAHISSTTTVPLEALAQRLLSIPQPGISLYALLTSVIPNSNNITVYESYRDKIKSAAFLIAQG